MYGVDMCVMYAVGGHVWLLVYGCWGMFFVGGVLWGGFCMVWMDDVVCFWCLGGYVRVVCVCMCVDVWYCLGVFGVSVACVLVVDDCVVGGCVGVSES